MKCPPVWTKRQLGDLLRIKHGFAFKGEFFSSDGSQIVLTPGNFRADGGIKLKGPKEKFYGSDYPPEFLLREGDMLVVMTDLTQKAPILGSPAIIPENDRYLHNQRLGKVVEISAEVDLTYLYYLFNSRGVRERLKATATGATVKHTSPDRIYAVEVRMPLIATQQKIAAILSTYDDLIENNVRRIQILEEMAQALYREWFVEFRFPGHEAAEWRDSEGGRIPSGWGVVDLGEVSDLRWGDTNTTKKSYLEKGFDAYSAAGLDGKLDHFDYDRDGIVLSAIGAGCGQTWFARGKWSCIKNTIRFWASGDSVTTEYLFYATLGKQRWPRRGAAQPFISQSDARQLQIIIPEPDLLSRFTEFAAACLGERNVLYRCNRILQKARDLLLPRLISGELDVSELDIDVGDAA